MIGPSRLNSRVRSPLETDERREPNGGGRRGYRSILRHCAAKRWRERSHRPPRRPHLRPQRAANREKPRRTTAPEQGHHPADPPDAPLVPGPLLWRGPGRWTTPVEGLKRRRRAGAEDPRGRSVSLPPAALTMLRHRSAAEAAVGGSNQPARSGGGVKGCSASTSARTTREGRRLIGGSGAANMVAERGGGWARMLMRACAPVRRMAGALLAAAGLVAGVGPVVAAGPTLADAAQRADWGVVRARVEQGADVTARQDAVERCRLLAGLVGRPAEPQATMGRLAFGTAMENRWPG